MNIVKQKNIDEVSSNIKKVEFMTMTEVLKMLKENNISSGEIEDLLLKHGDKISSWNLRELKSFQEFYIREYKKWKTISLIDDNGYYIKFVNRIRTIENNIYKDIIYYYEKNSINVKEEIVNKEIEKSKEVGNFSSIDDLIKSLD